MWRILDPFLVRIARRMEHLAIHHPSDYVEQLTRAKGVFSPLATVTNSAAVESAAAPGRLQVGDYAYIDGSISLLTPDSECRIGDHSFLGPHSRLWVLDSITIGNFVLIGPRVDVFDNDSHPLDARSRREDARSHLERNQPMDYSKVSRAAVVIEDDVWIGTKSTILKGVRIGRGAVVAADSVVTREVSPFTLVGGNPAREIRHLTE